MVHLKIAPPKKEEIPDLFENHHFWGFYAEFRGMSTVTVPLIHLHPGFQEND